MTIVAATAHRPQHVFDGTATHPGWEWIRKRQRDTLIALNATKGISGMAVGGDTTFAQACLDIGIPFLAAVPFEGQELLWPRAAQVTYHQLLAKAAEVVYVSPPGYSRDKMLIRNHYMVDRGNILSAVWNGREGGTSHTVHLAYRRQIPVHIIDPRDYADS